MRKFWDYFRGISLKSIIGNLLVFLIGYLLIHTYQTWDVPEGKVPELKGLAVNNHLAVDLHSVEKPVLLHFWATWCKICQLEHSSIKSIAEDYPVLSVASQSGDRSQVIKFIDENKLNFPVILDEDGLIFKQWGGVGYPTSFIINEQNEIAYVEAGFTTELGLRLRLFLSKYF